MNAELADRVAHPREQATRPWEHWGRLDIAWYACRHTGFLSPRPVTLSVNEALLRSGLVHG